MQYVTEYETKDGKTVKKEPEKSGKKFSVDVQEQSQSKKQEDK